MNSVITHQLIIVYLMYLIATASPGPSNLSIMGVAMYQGRSSAMVLALGVLCGSLFWAILAATGISAVLATYAKALLIIKIVGGVYLLYLAFKSAKSAMKKEDNSKSEKKKATYRVLFRQGVLMHLTNPKAILTWISIMSLGLHPDSPPFMYAFILTGCFFMGIMIFMGYAFIFSTRYMVSVYRRVRRWIEATIAIVFAGAGLGLLMSRN